MRILLNILTLFLAILSFGELHAQESAVPDTTVESRVQRVSQEYSLNISQESAYRALENRFHFSLDSLGKLSLSPEQRGTWLTQAMRGYDRSMKNILTSAQWQSMLAARRKATAALMKYAGDNRLHIKAIPRDDQ